jgi:hypothetical protein
MWFEVCFELNTEQIMISGKRYRLTFLVGSVHFLFKLRREIRDPSLRALKAKDLLLSNDQ